MRPTEREVPVGVGPARRAGPASSAARLAAPTYPFSALVGQDLLRRALLLNAVCPDLGGVLVAGDRGTAKTTAARGLAAVLPRLNVVRGCPFRCDPADVWLDCPHCRDATNRTAEEIAAPFVELPLGATEDRVAGSLDVERTLREGRPVFRPGLLAAAHRGVLYIDEVNLLAGHLVDLLLDAAATGTHTVEREGIAVRHPARFVLVGSMNPEEGELRPQLADRFALRVSVRTTTDPAARAEVVRRRLAFDADPLGFCSSWDEEQRQLSETVAKARVVFASVVLTDEQLAGIAAVCCEQHVEGLRADLALSRASRSLAALAGRTHVTADDLQAAAELVLPHRARPRPRAPEQPSHDWFGNNEDDKSQRTASVGETVVPPGDVGSVPRIELLAGPPTGSPNGGARCPLPAQPRGRYVRAVRDEAPSELALDATLRATALRGGPTLRPEDVHGKQRDDRLGSLVVFLVDASGSMRARRRMEAVKGVALALLADAGRLRDDVAVIAVRGPRAECLLLPSSDVRVAQQALARLPTGGRTPLAHGLGLAAELAGTSRPVLLVLVSDGKANVPLPGTDGDPWQQALAACAGFTKPNRKAVVIDAEEGVVQSGRAQELAAALGAKCLPLAALSAEGVGSMRGAT